MELIDTHSHIYYDKYTDINDVLGRAQENNVAKIICVGVDIKSSEKSINLAEKYDMVYATAGYHPHESKEASDQYLKELTEESFNIHFTAGHSLGEYTSLAASGALSIEETIKLVVERGRLMQLACEQTPGGMIAIIGVLEYLPHNSISVVSGIESSLILLRRVLKLTPSDLAA